MRVTDEPGLLQRRGDHAHGWPLHTEHHSQELVTEIEVLLLHPVVGHQQPSRAALLHLMQRIASRRLHHLCDEDLGVASHQSVERSLFFHSRRKSSTLIVSASVSGT